MNRYDPIQTTENVIDWDKDPFIKYQDLFKDTIDWAKDPMSHPTNQNKYFYSDGKTYYEQICKMLKLMSAFKESFAYIYENEEELHSAWENFVDNLSASAEYGEEVGVTLTWTEDSVNFDFTIPGGADGVGIQSIVFNQDYSMTITLTDGTVYNSPSLRGPQGETGATGAQGPQGPQGEGLEILDVYTTLADLQTAHPTGSAGDAYQVGTSPNFTLYIWSTSQQAWVPAGALTSPDATTTTPLMDGTASVGSENAYARGDHRHPTDTSRASASDLTTVSENLLELAGDVSDIADGLGAVQTEIEDLSDIVQVSRSLIDQEFLYRETPADHNTIGRLDSIKGNTISFNQLAHGNFTNTSEWTTATCTFSVSNNEGTMKATAQYGGIIQEINTVVGHKYLICVDALSSSQSANIRSVNGGINANSTKTSWEHFAFVITATNTTTDLRLRDGASSNWVDQYFKNAMCLDLTAMGIDSFTTADQVEAWLLAKLGPLVYFGYDPGSLISFKGTGLKTVGKNLLPLVMADIKTANTSGTWTDNVYEYSGSKYTFNVNSKGIVTSFILSGTATATNRIIFPYVFDLTFANGKKINGMPANGSATTYRFRAIRATTTFGLQNFSNNDSTVNITLTEEKCRFDLIVYSGYEASNLEFKPMLRYPDEDNTYEPYITNTLSLPTLTYFPTGMKDCSQSSPVFDEMNLTSGKGNEKVEMVDLGTLDWNYNPQYGMNSSGIQGLIKPPLANDKVANIACAIREVATYNQVYSGGTSRNRIGIVDNGVIGINTTETDPVTFKTQMSGAMLYYEKATPTEFDISLDLTYPIWNGGTEQLLPVNTSTPVTTPLLADITYMSTDEAIQYLYANGSANVESEISALDSRLDIAEDDIDTINTTIGSESTTPMSGILGRLNEAESDISFMEKKIVWQNPKESGWMSSFAETHIDLTDAGVENYRFLEVISILNSGGPFAVTTGPIALDFSYADHTGYGTLFNMGTTGATNNYLYHDRDISYFDSTKQLNIYDCYAHENGVAPYVTNNYLIPVLAIVYN